MTARTARPGCRPLFGAASAHAQTKELVMGNVNPPKHGTALAAQQFIESSPSSRAARPR